MLATRHAGPILELSVTRARIESAWERVHRIKEAIGFVVVRTVRCFFTHLRHDTEWTNCSIGEGSLALNC